MIPPSRRTLPKSRTWGRAWVAFIVALLVLALAAPADAKKKKKGGHKKGKTPSGKTTGGKAAPVDDETDEASDDEKEPTPSKPSGGPTPADEEKPPAPAGAEEVTKKPKPEKPAAEPDDSAGSGLPALQVGIGGKALFRTLSWTDDGGALSPYSLSPGPEVGGWLEVYPGAFMTTGFASYIGIFGSFNYGIGAKSQTPAGVNLTTKYQDFLVGLKVRIPLGMFNPYVSAAYGMQTFKLEPFAGVTDRPNFSYAFIRPGAGVRVQATPMLDIDLGAGYLLVNAMGTAAGEVKSAMYFPRATASGVDIGLSIGVRFSSLLGVRAGADLRQYGMNSGYRAGDAGPIAGGSTDRYIVAWGGLELYLDGVGGGPGGGGDEEAAPAKPAKPAAKKAAPPDELDEEKTEKEKE